MKVSKTTPRESERFTIELDYAESYALLYWLGEARKKDHFIRNLCWSLEDLRGDWMSEKAKKERGE